MEIIHDSNNKKFIDFCFVRPTVLEAAVHYESHQLLVASLNFITDFTFIYHFRLLELNFFTVYQLLGELPISLRHMLL